jgi:O-antigen/teichoic acid export membrane protein
MGDKLLRHGSIIFSASIISFFFAYVFQFYMARALGPENYGILGSMLSLLYIFSVPGSVITTTLTQIISEHKGRGEFGKIRYIFLESIQKLLYLGLIIFIVLILSSPFIKNILNLPSETPVIMLGFSLIFITVLNSPRGVLKGMQEFGSLGFNIAIEKPVLLLAGALFIYSGMGINGVLLSYGACAFVILVLALLSLRSILKEKSEKVSISIYKYASPIFIFILAITFLNSIDIFFVRRYFPAEISGFFTSLKMMGEVLYFLACALGGVLLPKVSEMKSLDKAHGFLLKKTLTYFGIVFAGVLFAYAIAPELIVTILFGKNYTSIAGYLVWYALAMGLLSLAVIFMFYDISVKRTAFRYPLILITFLDIFLLMVFHETIDQIIGVQIATFSMLLVTVIIIGRRSRYVNFDRYK